MVDSWAGLVSSEEFRKIHRLKTNPFHRKSVGKGKEPFYLNQGWTVERELKTRTWLHRKKNFYEYFEDKVWTSISKMGFTYMNSDRNSCR